MHDYRPMLLIERTAKSIESDHWPCGVRGERLRL